VVTIVVRTYLKERGKRKERRPKLQGGQSMTMNSDERHC